MYPSIPIPILPTFSVDMIIKHSVLQLIPYVISYMVIKKDIDSDSQKHKIC